MKRQKSYTVKVVNEQIFITVSLSVSLTEYLHARIMSLKKINKFSWLIAVAKYSNNAAQQGQTESLQGRLWAEQKQSLNSKSRIFAIKYGLLTKCEVKMAGYWPKKNKANI